MSALTDSGHTEPLELLETNGSKRPEAAQKQPLSGLSLDGFLPGAYQPFFSY
jgi:hypothetical protein